MGIRESRRGRQMDRQLKEQICCSLHYQRISKNPLNSTHKLIKLLFTSENLTKFLHLASKPRLTNPKINISEHFAIYFQFRHCSLISKSTIIHLINIESRQTIPIKSPILLHNHLLIIGISFH